MALFEIATLGTFAKLLLAARKLAEDGDPLNRLKALADLAENGKKLRAALGEQNLGPLAVQIEKDCEAADAAFAHEAGVADARIIFRDVAGVALTRSDALAEHGLVQADIMRDMVAAIDASDFARDFRATPLAEAYFRGVMDAALKSMLANPAFIDGLSPQLWRTSLRRQGVQIEMLSGLESKLEQGFAEQADMLKALLSQVEVSGEVARLSEAGVTEAAILKLAQGISAEVADLQHAWTELQGAIDVAIRVQQEGRHGSDLGNFVQEVLRRVALHSAQGEYDEAAAKIDAALADEKAAHKARTIRLLDAGLEQDRLRRNPKAAAGRALRKAETGADGSLDFAALRAVQEDWRARGHDRGLSFDQEVAIELARGEIAIAGSQDERGRALTDLGIALRGIGEREASTARLEEAVTSYRTALEVLSRDRKPLDWADAQQNLGSALAILGRRSASTSRLNEAVAAYRAAMEVQTRECEPMEWATSQIGLGAAFHGLGERESGTGSLKKAVAAYRAALKELTQESTPTEWAMAQSNLGSSLARLGERETNTKRMEDAIAAFNAALTVWTRNKFPINWSLAKMNLGTVLTTLGHRETSFARLEEAVAAYHAALEERTRERVPLDWAMTQMNLGNALSSLGIRQEGTERLNEAVAAYDAALEEWTRERVPLDWALVQGNLAKVQLALFDKTNDVARLDAAETYARAALAMFETAHAGRYEKIAKTTLAGVARRRANSGMKL